MTVLGPGDSVGRYRIVRFIARGAMGSVYEAEDTLLGRPVALKVLVPELLDDPEFQARFVREARALTAMDSPHIIKLFDHGVHDRLLYLVTQLVRGRDLAARLEDGPLPVGQALDVAGQVASALSDAHALGLLHRDVKPSNVLVGDHGDGELFAYLIDFGIVREEDGEQTSTGLMIGTTAYMAPERHRGEPASVASDIYSLGCLLWALLTGRAPYVGRTGVSVALAHLQDPVPVWSGPEGTDPVDEVLRRSMAKDPRDRYQSAAAMRAALRDAARRVPRQPPAPDATAVRLRPAVPSAGAGSTVVPPARGASGASGAFGAATVAGAWAAPVPTSPVGPQPTRPRHRALVGAIVAAVVLAVVGGGVAVALSQRDDTDPARAADARQQPTSGPATPRGSVPSTPRSSASTTPPSSDPTTSTGKPPGALPGWAPKISTGADNRVTGLDFTGTPEPTGALQVATVIEGDGAPVEVGQDITAHFFGSVYGSDTSFDESFSGQPFTAPIGVGSLIEGWDKAIPGVPVGSRIIMSIPPELGYGDQDQAGIPAGSTLFFVIDIISAEGAAQ